MSSNQTINLRNNTFLHTNTAQYPSITSPTNVGTLLNLNTSPNNHDTLLNLDKAPPPKLRFISPTFLNSTPSNNNNNANSNVFSNVPSNVQT